MSSPTSTTALWYGFFLQLDPWIRSKKYRREPYVSFTMTTILSYEELLVRSEKCTMHVNRLRYLCIEIFKTVNQLNPEFMQNIFETRTSNRPSRRPNDLQHYRLNQKTFGSNSLRSLGPQIWNRLPDDIKSAENLVQFKRLIKSWDGATCRCNAFVINSLYNVFKIFYKHSVNSYLVVFSFSVLYCTVMNCASE